MVCCRLQCAVGADWNAENAKWNVDRAKFEYGMIRHRNLDSK